MILRQGKGTSPIKPPSKLRNKLPSLKEHAETAAVVSWWRRQYPKLAKHLIGLPNAGKRSSQVAAMLKAEGMIPGASDLFLAIPKWGYHGMWIEMKRKDGVPSDVSENQSSFQADMRSVGYIAEVCFGAEQAIAMIKHYLEVGVYE